MVLKKVLFLIFVLGSVPVWAKSMTGCTKPTVSVVLKKEQPTYLSKPYNRLTSICGSSRILGCTKADYTYSYEVVFNEKGCKQLNFTYYPTNFYVYIDSKYHTGSCEYNAVKKHEDLHVSAIQNLSPKAIKQFLLKCIDDEIQKKQLKSGEKIYEKCAQDTVNWLDLKKEEKNREIDSYKRYHPFYFSKCKNWKMPQSSINATLDALLN